jgi:hypothetical protein
MFFDLKSLKKCAIVDRASALFKWRRYRSRKPKPLGNRGLFGFA